VRRRTEAVSLRRVHCAATTRHIPAGFSQDIGMLHDALVFLAAALVAAVFGFTGIAGTPLAIARILCVAFALRCTTSLFLLRRGTDLMAGQRC
jgi:uncharacterized membrane protein YtjA (UPF0391 family)